MSSVVRKLPKLQEHGLPPVTSKYMSLIPFVWTLSGTMRSGKSHLAIGLTLNLLREGSINKVFLLSPTADSNSTYKNILKEGRDVLYTDLSPKVYSTLGEIQMQIQALADQWAEELQYIAALKALSKGEPLTAVQEHLVEVNNYRPPRDCRPKPLLLIDDAQGSALFHRTSKNTLNSFVIQHRHIAGGVGCSVILIGQTWLSGVPRALRTNSTHIALFRCSSQTDRKAMYSDLCSDLCTYEQFEKLLDAYTAKPFGYMFIDKVTKEIKPSY